MRLDPEELRELAAFCARRFPEADARLRLARESGVPAPSPLPAAAGPAWEALLVAAQDRGQLPALARALAAAAPGDANLQAACAALTEPPAPSRSPARLVGVGLAGVALLVGGWLALRPTPEAPSAPAPATDPAAAPAPAATPAAEPVLDEPAATASAAPAPSPASAEPVPAAPSPASAEPVPAAPSPASTTAPTGCDALPGPIVGWWYAGERSPGAVGDVITLTRDARVRADYPRAENGHDPRAAERCVLSRGDRVRLTHAPIDASRGRWWVPYAPGDRVR